MKNFTILFALLLLVGCSANKTYEIVINPTPHSIERTSNRLISIKQGFNIVNTPSELASALQFITPNSKGLPLSVSYGSEVSAKAGVKQIDGAYVFKSTKKSVEIIAFNERGAYYGIQTLRQLIRDNRLPEVTINDYPDIPYRGVVEGFYGTPWSHEVRKSLINFYGENKMTSYLYGPKDDPYHSSPKWREPYPKDEEAKLKELVEIADANRVDFVWAIHPGKDIKWTESDYQKLLKKFEDMYRIGVRSFAIFFDDISGIGTNPHRQSELLNRLHSEFVEVKGDVKPLIMCPTDYTSLWANPSETGYLSILGDTLHPSIHIMWTGESVCCDITDNTLEWVNSRINRPTFIWWNYPVTDYVKHIIMQGPVYGNTQIATSSEMAGFVSNPMEHGEASKLALYSVADYTWNVKDYQSIVSWERALKHLMPNLYNEYRTFAIHSTDTETGYRRNESWETTTFTLDNYTTEQKDSLKNEFNNIVVSSSAIIDKCQNKLLVAELKPWLVQAKRLGERGLTTIELIDLYNQGDVEGVWDKLPSTILRAKELGEYRANRVGTYKLNPFINATCRALADSLYYKVSGKKSYLAKPISSFKNISTEQGGLMLDKKSDTYYHSAYAQGNGSWIGVDMGRVIPIKHIYIEQGRNSVDDVDYFDAARLEVSVDGDKWHTLRGDIVNEYDISWRGEDVQARYVRLVRLDSSKRTNWLAVRRFEVNPTLDKAQFVTNVKQLEGVTLDNLSAMPIYETVKVQPMGYFGVELPLVIAIKSVEYDFGDTDAKIEFSSDGLKWGDSAASAKYIRYINRTDKVKELFFKKFYILSYSQPDNSHAELYDGDIMTSYPSTGEQHIAIPSASREVIIFSHSKGASDDEIEIRNIKGDILSKYPVSKGIEKISLVDDAVYVVIRGDIEIGEVIFN